MGTGGSGLLRAHFARLNNQLGSFLKEFAGPRLHSSANRRIGLIHTIGSGRYFLPVVFVVNRQSGLAVLPAEFFAMTIQ
jgi:hypothetical protein